MKHGKGARRQVLSIRDMTYIALCAALLVVCAWITIPFTVPFTMQTFGVFVSVGLLGTKRGTFAVLIYMLLGLVGLPVFSGFQGGPGVLFGITGGYIIGFVFGAWIMGSLQTVMGCSFWESLVVMGLGLITCYLFGTVWYVLVYMRGGSVAQWAAAVQSCVLPYILPDCGKICLAAVVVRRVRPFLRLGGSNENG